MAASWHTHGHAHDGKHPGPFGVTGIRHDHHHGHGPQYELWAPHHDPTHHQQPAAAGLKRPAGDGDPADGPDPDALERAAAHQPPPEVTS